MTVSPPASAARHVTVPSVDVSLGQKVLRVDIRAAKHVRRAASVLDLRLGIKVEARCVDASVDAAESGQRQLVIPITLGVRILSVNAHDPSAKIAPLSAPAPIK